jgi:hypothetical protein
MSLRTVSASPLPQDRNLKEIVDMMLQNVGSYQKNYKFRNPEVQNRTWDSKILFIISATTTILTTSKKQSAQRWKAFNSR